MKSGKIINTNIFFSLSAFISFLIFSLTGLYATVLLAINYHYSILGWIGFTCFFVGPLIFSSQWKKIFKRKAIVFLDEDFFGIQIFKNKSEVLEKEHKYYYSQIKSYKVGESSNDDSCVLSLIFKNGRKKVTFTFLKQKPENNIINSFVSKINKLNSINSEENKITIMPNLFATKKGTYFIIVLTIMLIGVIVLQIYTNPKTIPLTLLPGIILYVSIFSQRKKDIDQFTQMKN
ncbi:MAG: hypothetical protein JSU03_03415 [Bacteroidetes bacterium]|nr:hypothetical protein [Bacteroidota bacterium]